MAGAKRQKMGWVKKILVVGNEGNEDFAKTDPNQGASPHSQSPP